MEKFAKQLQKEAQVLGACSPGLLDLKNVGDNKAALVQLYMSKLEFCLEHDFPSNEFIKEHGKGIMESFGLFLDDKINLTNYRKCVALGKTSGKINVSSYGVSQIYAKHTSDLVIEASDNAFVMVYVYDDAKVTIHAHDRAKVHVNRYGGKTITAKDGQAVVKVVEKQLNK
jgi:hypothetical protein